MSLNIRSAVAVLMSMKNILKWFVEPKYGKRPIDASVENVHLSLKLNGTTALEYG